jgi:hypothetical protein
MRVREAQKHTAPTDQDPETLVLFRVLYKSFLYDATAIPVTSPTVLFQPSCLVPSLCVGRSTLLFSYVPVGTGTALKNPVFRIRIRIGS